jgi:hypothetical protein
MNRRSFLKLSPAFPAAAATVTLTLREEGQQPVELDVRVLKLQKGDIVVLSAQQHLSVDACTMIQRHWADHFEGIKALVLQADLKVEGVLRP